MREFVQMEKNTVKADNQLNGKAVVRMDKPAGSGHRVLFVGNSITLHGVKPEIGWHGEWGMAASAPEKDYVHRVMAMVRAHDEDAACAVCQVASWERQYKDGGETLERFSVAREFGADIIVIRMVENCSKEDVQPDVFCTELRRLLSYLDPDGTARVVIGTGFWRHPLDEALRRFAAENGTALVELGDLGERDEMKAIGLFAHEGVANHPGDRGMEAIAARLFEAMQPWL